MPLFQKKIQKGLLLCIWNTTESLDVLLKIKQVSGTDTLALNSISHESRKKEWLVARIVLEELTEKKDARIIYDKHHKPFLENSKQHISISHSHSVLAVIIGDTETGIDIELVKSTVAKVQEKYMSASELSSLQEENQIEQLTVYWCAKESLYKVYGKKELGFKENLMIEPFQYSGNGTIKGWIRSSSIKKAFNLQYEKLQIGSNSYMLTYVINQV